MNDPRELLRQLNPEPGCPAPPIERLWARLARERENAQSLAAIERGPAAREAGGQRADVQSQPARSVAAKRSWGSGLVVGLSAALTIAVIAGALLVPADRRSPRPAALPSAKQGLVGILGVLRRPQTKADLQLGVALRSALDGPLSRSHIPVTAGLRLATVTPWGEKVFLIPTRPRPGQSLPKGPRQSRWITGQRLAVLGPGAACCTTAAGIIAGDDWITGGAGSLNYMVLVVPDGVARVTVGLSRPITAAVHGNVAAFKTPGPVENPTVYGMSWYGPSGAIVKRFKSSLPSRAQSTAMRSRLLVEDEHSTVRIAPQIAARFPLFKNTQTGTFGQGSNSFTISRPAVASLPTFVLTTGIGGGQPTAVTKTRELTTTSGARIWILAGNTICVFGEPGERVGACSADPGETLKTGMAAQPLLPNGQRLLVGIVPDTNRTITVQTTHGGAQSIQVHDGIFITSAPGVLRYRVNGINGKAVWVNQ